MIKNVLITGANRGLGEALVNELKDNKDLRIFATARGSSFIEISKKFKDYPNIHVRELDLLHPETFTPVIKEINKNFGGIDILINNAAMVYRSMVEHVSDDEEKRGFQVNYFAPRELIRRVLPLMKKKKYGKIINISSVGGMMAMPTMSSYSASKWSLEGMSEALWYELKPFNIQVCIVQIGFVNSNSFQNVEIPKKAQKDTNKIYQEYYSTMEKFISRCMNSTYFTPEKIAKRIHKKLIKKEHIFLRFPGTHDAIIFYWFRRFVPRKIYHWILYISLPNNLKRNIKNIINFYRNN